MTRRATGPPHANGWIAPAATLCLLLLVQVAFFAHNGYSSGDDLPFHLGSWASAAQQLRHGLYPRWDAAAALGAGEPRFVFYPPLSWLLGALLSTLATPAHAAEWFVCLSMAACWLGMYRAARQRFAVGAALLTATVYSAAPYTLFNALQRAAFGELLASAWLPLLFAACLSPAPRVAAIAVPLALLWLTNVPTAVLGSYLLLSIAVFRLISAYREKGTNGPAQLAAVFASGAGLGLLLPAFFLLPALREAAAVQLVSAFGHGQSFRDNFLLRHTAFTSRQTMHVVTRIVALYVVALGLLLGTASFFRRRPMQGAAQGSGYLLPLLAWLSVLWLLLLLPLSAPVWQYLPKLSVLQFPWRLLSVMTLLLAFAVGLLADRFTPRRWPAVGASAVLATLLITAGATTYWRNPQERETTGETRAAVAARTESRATQEYTPVGATNLGLQPMGAAACLTSAPEQAATEQQDLQSPPFRMTFHLPAAEPCTLPVRDYPAWTVLLNGRVVPHTHRNDGRLVLLVPPGESHVEVRWQLGMGGWIGTLVSAGALMILLVVRRRPTAA